MRESRFIWNFPDDVIIESVKGKERGWFADNPTNPHVPGAIAADSVPTDENWGGERVKTIERNLWQKSQAEHREYAQLFTEDGELKYEPHVGTRNDVADWPDKGGVVFHTHIKNQAFSAGDFEAMVGQRRSAIRMRDADGRLYVLSGTVHLASAWPGVGWYWEGNYNRLYGKYLQMSEGDGPQNAWAEYTHLICVATAKTLGLEYRRYEAI